MAAKIAPTRPSLWRNWTTILRTCSSENAASLDSVSRWLIATRACVQPMTLTSAAVAGLLAVRHPAFRPELFALAAAGLVFAHAANNMINDFFDLEAGLDTTSYPRALYAPQPVLAGVITRRQLVTAIFVANALDAAIMLVLFWLRGWPVVAFALGGLFLSVFYVAPPLRLKARGLGEPSVLVIWGPLMVGGTYYAAVGELPVEVLWTSLPYGLLVATVLMGKHIDKIPWDAPQDMRTLPVVLGEEAARRLTLGLMASFYASVVVLVATGALAVWALVVLGGVPLLVKTWRTYSRAKPDKPPQRYPVWPMWYAAWSFVHTRRAGALLVLGLAVGAVWPVHVV